ncbi:sporulation protein YlmC with PRC-barrel domain [Constrictibacter sp. MBR-5]|jgi:sporulation protein YlmC with PRC-barrel domain|uniref:PRC-barrel domain-containing protein n=1 Tax=Constrictibacter sp. MBR-5 TaxID=3156467 RepID=UPI0033998C99
MTRIFGTTAIALVIGAFALPAAAQQNQAAKGRTMQNACWQQLSRFDDDKDGSIGPQELAANKRDIFAALNRDNDDEISRDEYMRCFSAQGGQNRMQQTFTDLDRDRNQRISEAEFTEGDRLERTQVMVEQRRPQVTVQQSQPTVTVDQKRPTVQVEQAQPTVTVDQKRPTVNVTQPQPEVTVQQAQPKVEVTQPQPKVSVQQAEPKVRVEQAQPRVMVEQAKPKVEIDQAKPKVQVDQADPKVKVEQADPKVNVDRQAGADVNRINPDRERGTPVERAQNAGDRGQPVVGVAVVDTDRTWADGKPIEMNRMRADQILGRDIVNLRGNEVGDVEDIVMSRDGDALFAVISVGGFLGIGDKDVVVPFSELRMGDDNMILMSQKSEDGLRDMPAYDENQYQRYER